MTTVPATDRRARRIVVAGCITIAIVIMGYLVWPSRPGPVVLNTGTPRHLVTITIDRLRIGNSDIHITITDRAGAPIHHAAVWLQANQPIMGHAGQPASAMSAGPGRFHAAAVPLMMTGPWELRLSIDTHDRIDELVLPVWVGG